MIPPSVVYAELAIGFIILIVTDERAKQKPWLKAVYIGWTCGLIILAFASNYTVQSANTIFGYNGSNIANATTTYTYSAGLLGYSNNVQQFLFGFVILTAIVLILNGVLEAKDKFKQTREYVYSQLHGNKGSSE